MTDQQLPGRQPPIVTVDRERTLPAEFEPYIAMMGFLASVLGPRAEIVLHDTSDPSSSVVAIANGHVSGRRLGAPATDLVLRVLRREDEREYLANYPATSSDGVQFRSSTLFVRNHAQRVVGMLCVNIDDGPLLAARESLAALTATTDLYDATTSRPPMDTTDQPPLDLAAQLHQFEKLSLNVDELTVDAVTRAADLPQVSPERMTTEEKLAAVRKLEATGIFLMKGSVSRVARILQVSEPSMYRYLRQVRHSA